jgi:hypothetical protein
MDHRDKKPCDAWEDLRRSGELQGFLCICGRSILAFREEVSCITWLKTSIMRITAVGCKKTQKDAVRLLWAGFCGDSVYAG